MENQPEINYYCWTENGEPQISAIHEKGFETYDNHRVIPARSKLIAEQIFMCDLYADEIRRRW